MGKPKKIRRLLFMGLTLGLSAALSPGTWAAPLPVPGVQPGKTAVGVRTVNINPASLSVTVPLYLTVAAISDADGNSRIVAPDGYLMRNTTGSAPDGTYPEIAVTAVKVRGVKDGTWSLKNKPQSGKEVRLSVGGLILPEVSAGSGEAVQADITAPDNLFYDSAAKVFRPIPGGPSQEGLILPVTGLLGAGFKAGEERAAAQFRISYTVSLLDEGGQPVGISYDGPSMEDAASPGLPPSTGGSK